MKKTNFVKFATLITVFAMLVGVMAGVSFVANAEEESETTGYTVGMKNLVYADYFHIALTVEGELEGVTGDKGVAVFAKGADIATADPLYVTYTKYNQYAEDGETVEFQYYVTQAVAAKEIAVTYDYYPVIKDAEGKVHYGDVYSYSVVDYCNERLGELAAIVENGNVLNAKQENQKVLYNATKAYGEAADALIK